MTAGFIYVDSTADISSCRWVPLRRVIRSIAYRMNCWRRFSRRLTSFQLSLRPITLVSHPMECVSITRFTNLYWNKTIAIYFKFLKSVVGSIKSSNRSVSGNRSVDMNMCFYPTSIFPQHFLPTRNCMFTIHFILCSIWSTTINGKNGDTVSRESSQFQSAVNDCMTNVIGYLLAASQATRRKLTGKETFGCPMKNLDILM